MATRMDEITEDKKNKQIVDELKTAVGMIQETGIAEMELKFKDGTKIVVEIIIKNTIKYDQN